MLTNAILNQCFDILLQQKNADEAIAQIAKIFADNEMVGHDTVGDLLSNASTFFPENDVPLSAQEKKSISMVRNKAVAHFLSFDDSRKYFNQLGERGKLPIVRMLSNFMFWDKEIMLGAISCTDNVEKYRVPTSFSSDFDSTLLEYFLAQQSFGGHTIHAGEVAEALLIRGCEIDFENKKNIQNLSSERAIQSKLTFNVLQHYIDQKNPDPLFYLIRETDNSCREVAATYSRKSSASSMSSGTIAAAALVESLAKEIINTNLDSSKINSVTAPARSTHGAISIPCFFLERDNNRDRYPVSSRIWRHIQAKARIEKLTPEIFERDQFFLHTIVASNNALLLSFAIQKIGQIEGVEDRKRIYQNKKNNTSPFELACKLGYDYAIEELFDKADNDDIEGGLELCAQEGKAVSLHLLVSKIKDANLDINMDRALLYAILSNRETIASFLLDNKADLNCRALMAVDDESVQNISPLEAAILMDNFDLVAGLINRGAFYSEDGVDIEAYKKYKEKNLHIQDDLIELERKAVADKDKFIQSFSVAVDGVKQCKDYLSQDILIDVRRKTSQLDGLRYPQDLALQQEISESISVIFNIALAAKENKLEISASAVNPPVAVVGPSASQKLESGKKEEACVMA